ncbi:MAG TPA: hypothetical protein VMB03_08885 [Bryobacteraceae bacterium]|nr:hypothetical protein [Bryobacteraceae bacterium]
MAAFALRQTTHAEVNPNETRDTLFLLGGLSLILFGAGLVVTNPAVRKLLGGVNAGSLLQAAVPDLERYMKLRSM